MSHRRPTRRNLSAEESETDDSDDDSGYFNQHSQESAARRFLWDEDIDDPKGANFIVGSKRLSREHTVDEVNLMDDSSAKEKRIGDIPPKWNPFAAPKVTSKYDADPAYDYEGASPRTHRFGLAAACRNCYHTLLGGCGMCLEWIFSAACLSILSLGIFFVGAVLGISYAFQNWPVDQGEYPVSEEFRRENITSILEANPYIDSASFQIPASDQENALDWLVDIDAFRGSDNISHRYALASFYFGAISDWKNRDGWLESTSVCTWHGVQCVDGQVVKLTMVDNHLRGALNPEIGAIETLETLDLHKNHLSGTIPTEIANLEFLVTLNLMDNNFSGVIPSVQAMTSLRELNLGKNLLESVDSNGFADLVELQALGLQKNSLRASISQLKLPRNLGRSFG